MSNLTNLQVVSAYSRLLEYSSNKRYGLIDNNFSDNRIDSIALEYNKEIKNKTGLDILEIDSAEKIILYENEVDRRISDFTYKNIVPKYLSEKEKLIRTVQPFSKDNFLQLKVIVGANIKDQLKGYPLTIPDISSILKRPIAIQLACFEDVAETGTLFFTAEKNIKGKKRIILFLIERSKKESFNPILENHISLIGVFSKEEYFQLAESPIDLFFELLNLYGYEFKIGEKAGKYVYSEVIPNFSGSPAELLHVNCKKDASFTSAMKVKFGNFSVSTFNIYAFDHITHLNDSLRGKV